VPDLDFALDAALNPDAPRHVRQRRAAAKSHIRTRGALPGAVPADSQKRPRARSTCCINAAAACRMRAAGERNRRGRRSKSFDTRATAPSNASRHSAQPATARR